ncbi:hypothetical protein ATE92_2714 [Ulvibacter sp. MAR_2010_11]|uniref:GNAT family N-acetyltransferase n=1 Tax=Ulvibacter sp. MAR_2010_11 TaxID=1250229 RepID=UPI000C2CBE4C|nr:GNAT family N-acetyltransferase [Ulvibacter sp. MAR_2010_11]PKA84519.1 hypothetical protein ATE92_2714 [Ulvibacter sp. MAR_2010_11]
MFLSIRKAKKSEIDWINERYKEINFVGSTFENEFIAIAECDATPSGLGRLVLIDDDNLELGGMYVFDAYRGLHISEEIIKFLLLKNTLRQETIWCLPFQHLKHIYERFGFKEYKGIQATIPLQIRNKYSWCAINYPTGVSLLYKIKE